MVVSVVKVCLGGVVPQTRGSLDAPNIPMVMNAASVIPSRCACPKGGLRGHLHSCV